MQKSVTVKGRKFTVPVDAKIGYSWGRRGMIKWHPGIELDKIRAHERKLDAEYR